MTDTVWAPDGSNLVVHADNAEYLPSLPDGAFTLIYVDPPFNTGRAQRRQETRMVLNADGDGDRVGFKGRSYDTIKGALHQLRRRVQRLLVLPGATARGGLAAAGRRRHPVPAPGLPGSALRQGDAGRHLRPRVLPERDHLGLRLRGARQVPLAHQARQHPRVREEPGEVPLRQRRGGPGAVHGARAWSPRPSASSASCPPTSGGTPSSPPPARKRPATRRRSPRA